MTRFDREQLQCLFISVYSKSTAEIEQKKITPHIDNSSRLATVDRNSNKLPTIDCMHFWSQRFPFSGILSITLTYMYVDVNTRYQTILTSISYWPWYKTRPDHVSL